MTALAARARPDAATFVLRLATAADATELQRWLDDARAGERAVYATGLALPRQAEGVRLVTRWKEAGLVVTTQQRDPTDARRWQFLAERTAHLAASTLDDGCRATEAAALDRLGARTELRKLLCELRGCAERGRPCPSLAQLAHDIGLPRGNRGRMRVKYLLGRLEADKLIAMECRGTTLPRVVTILAAGRAQGKRTAA